jgi:type VI secretion system secreted protein VgrG
MQSIELKVGQSSIKLDQTGVTIKGIMIKVEAQAMLEEKAPMNQIKGDGMLILKGGLTMIN